MAQHPDDIAYFSYSHSLPSCFLSPSCEYSNRLLSVSAGQAHLIPSVAEGRTNVHECAALFKGMQYCTTARYNMAASEDAPYFPLNGETKYVK